MGCGGIDEAGGKANDEAIGGNCFAVRGAVQCAEKDIQANVLRHCATIQQTLYSYAAV